MEKEKLLGLRLTSDNMIQIGNMINDSHSDSPIKCVYVERPRKASLNIEEVSTYNQPFKLVFEREGILNIEWVLKDII